jgi:hypothetical protein
MFAYLRPFPEPEVAFMRQARVARKWNYMQPFEMTRYYKFSELSRSGMLFDYSYYYGK